MAVWAVHDGEKVKRDDRQNANKARNAIWDGARIKLVAARNEIVAFQVIVEAGATGIERLSAALPSLTRQAGQAGKARRGGAAGARTRCHRLQGAGGRSHRLSRAAHSDLLAALPAGHGSHARDVGLSSRYARRPEESARLDARAARARERDRGTRRLASPRRRQSESGTLVRHLHRPRPRARHVSRRGDRHRRSRRRRRIPIEIEVLDVTLPDENSLRAMIYYQAGSAGAVSRAEGSGPGVSPLREAPSRRVRARLRSGSARKRRSAGSAEATSRQRKDTKGLARASAIGSFRARSTDRAGPSPIARRRGARRTNGWRSSSANAPNAFTFLYMPDEPRPAQFPEIVALADHLRANPGPGKRLPHVRDARVCAGARAGDRHLVRRAVALRPVTRGQRARGRQAVLVLQRRAPADWRDHHRLAGGRFAHGRLGGVQAWTPMGISTGMRITGGTTVRRRWGIGIRTCG